MHGQQRPSLPRCNLIAFRIDVSDEGFQFVRHDQSEIEYEMAKSVENWSISVPLHAAQGVVIYQARVAGSHAAANDAVDLVVSQGPPGETQPAAPSPSGPPTQTP